MNSSCSVSVKVLNKKNVIYSQSNINGAYMSRDMSFPTTWYVWPAKAQTSLRICADWSEPLLII